MGVGSPCHAKPHPRQKWHLNVDESSKHHESLRLNVDKILGPTARSTVTANALDTRKSTKEWYSSIDESLALKVGVWTVRKYWSLVTPWFVYSCFFCYHFVYSSFVYCCFVYSTFLLLFHNAAFRLLNFDLATKVLLAFVGLLGVLLQGTSTDIQCFFSGPLGGEIFEFPLQTITNFVRF